MTIKNIHMLYLIALLVFHCTSCSSANKMNRLEYMPQEEYIPSRGVIGEEKPEMSNKIDKRFACNSFIQCIGFFGKKLASSDTKIRLNPKGKNRSVIRIILMYG